MSKQKYEVVFIDCPNLKNFKDATVLSASIDGLILVISEGKTRRRAVKIAIASLEQKKINLLGAILDNRTFAIPRMIYERV